MATKVILMKNFMKILMINVAELNLLSYLYIHMGMHTHTQTYVSTYLH